MTFEELCENSFNDYQKAMAIFWIPDTQVPFTEPPPATWVDVSEGGRSLWRRHIEDILKNSGMQEVDLKEFKKSEPPKESLYIVEVFDSLLDSWESTSWTDPIGYEPLPAPIEKAAEALKCAIKAYPKNQYRISPVEALPKSV